ERPTDQPVTIVSAEQPRTAPAQTATAPAPAPAIQTQAASGAYAVQIASQPTAELAQATAADLARRYSDVLGGRAISIQQAEIEGRGTFHRVRVAADTRQDAVALCEAYKRAGGSCFVSK
ncbi:MAG: SPOR domain-containing protein, partial [Oricola sp.]